jgi:hypothetical protein
MLLTGNRLWFAALALGLLATTPANAWAYVDPGTGSYLFQLGAAGFFAGMFTLRRCWQTVKARFAAQRMTASADTQAADPGE